MTWIAKDRASTTHEVAGERYPVNTPSGWKWNALALCGRRITGVSGQSAFDPECRTCRKSLRKADR